jgi:[NiFe] hydrogenase large subunit/hydrogenase large subunit
METIAALDKLVADGLAFVSRVYLPDVLAIASYYKDWASIGAGIGNYMCYGEYPEDDNENPQLFLSPGIIYGRDLTKIATVDQSRVSEYVAHSWYDYSVGDDKGLNPFDGETKPHYTGPKPPYERLEVAQKYSWLKSPRYDGAAMEVGPLARMLIAYASGRPARVKELVDKVLSTLRVGPEALFSTLGRVAARAVEAQVLVESMDMWVRGLADNMARRDYRIQDNSKWDPSSWPRECLGAGFHEAPRGSLGHWVHISNGSVVNYQCVVPSTWNAGPRDAKGQPGPYEVALVGTPVAKPEQPLEILRTLHSFDPCMACAVHVVDGTKRELARVRVM